MWNGGTDAKTGEKLKYVSNDAKTGEKLKNVSNDSKTGEKLKYVSNDAKTGLNFFYCIYMYNLQCIICTQSRGAKMQKNRNDCAKHNIIKYDIKTKQIQIIYANMHGYTSTCNRDIIDIV